MKRELRTPEDSRGLREETHKNRRTPRSLIRNNDVWESIREARKEGPGRVILKAEMSPEKRRMRSSESKK